MTRPSCTAATIVRKLSSSRIIFAASLETSVPVIPIATPISAAFRAGASFTPSPVIAVTCPRFCKVFTIRNLCVGETRAKTEICSISSSSSWSLIFSSSMPVMACPFELVIPSSRAMCIAVRGWSPVIMTTRIPALLHNATASFTSARGGSIMPTKPIKVNPCSKSESKSGVSSVLYATPKMRIPLAASDRLASSMFWRYTSDNG